ncbi:hypothetical protein BD410DRAFT_498575 [Rickenella mellea]|uniref:Uncharacterized protein n=1 Tax=Rickenella mellea TaxID=50990 RepID=A0A4Y7PT00_9AGAM|nr:hypothetical protein BD410DRAFT_498575 [Rickenella mellea]
MSPVRKCQGFSNTNATLQVQTLKVDRLPWRRQLFNSRKKTTSNTSYSPFSLFTNVRSPKMGHKYKSAVPLANCVNFRALLSYSLCIVWGFLYTLPSTMIHKMSHGVHI